MPEDRGSFALQVQLLGSGIEQTLALGHVAALRSRSRRFTPANISELVHALRLPLIANTSANLRRLRAQSLVVSDGPGSWALTPLGEQRSRHLIGDVDLRRIDAESVSLGGAWFASTEHKIVPPDFAPPRWAAGIARMLDRFPFDSNVFCMTRFPGEGGDTDPVAAIIEVAREELKLNGLTLHLASDRQFEDDLLGNVGAYTWACKYGLGLLENRAGKGLNYNVVIELGSMIVLGRRCAMLMDTSAPTLPTDLSGQIYKSVNFDDVDSVRGAVSHWVREDLGLDHGRREKVPS